MNQAEITQWEIENIEEIIGWVIEYEKNKIVTFNMKDKSKNRFEVEKEVDKFDSFYKEACESNF